MALTVKKKATLAVADLLGQFQKDHGAGIGSFGGRLQEAVRIPTGLFPLDLALGGGFPRGKASIIYGPESSGKTNLCLLAIANHQRLWPEQTCMFFDVENSFDPKWARMLGVDLDRLAVVSPTYGEQIVDMVEAALYTSDCGLVVFDSLAALITTGEANASAERANVGGSGLLSGKLCRKVTLALAKAEQDGRMPTVLYINQTRYKVGVMYGDPETTPGGNAPKFQANIILRVYGKNVIDPKISKTMPVRKFTKFVVKKWKTPIMAVDGDVEMVTLPHAGMKPGQCEDSAVVEQHLRAFGLFEKGPKGKGWVILDETYDTQKPFFDRLAHDHEFGTQVRRAIVEKLMASGEFLEESEGQGETPDNSQGEV